MGLREKVAILLAFFTFTQVVFVCCSPKDKTPNKSYLVKKKQARNIEVITRAPSVVTLRPTIKSSKTRSKQDFDRSYEALRKIFNFPDNEYPTASTPRPPFYLQETNILQRSPVQRAVDYPTSTTQQMPKSVNIKQRDKQIYKSKPTNFKTVKKPGAPLNAPDFGTTPNPYYIREEIAFPEVEYPLSAKDTWTPYYWKPISSMGSKNQDNDIETPLKPSSNAKGNIRSTGQVSVKSGNVSKPKSKKALKKKLVETLPPIKNSGNTANKKSVTEESTSTNSKLKSSKIKNETNSNTTTPFELTPYTTLYFDTTPTYPSTKTTFIDENSTVGDVSNKQKKKSTKKKISSTKSSTSSSLIDIYKGQVESDIPKNSSIVKSSTTTFPIETTTKSQVSCSTETPYNPICEANLSLSDTCFNNMSNDILSTAPLATPTSCLNNNIDSTHILLNRSENDKLATFSKDKNFTSISDAVHTIVSNNRYNKESSCFEDSATTLINNKSSTCEDKTIDSLMSPREDVIVRPSSDEEFTTDVLPDFDENDLLPIYTVTTSTLSPSMVSNVDEAWQNSDVIDPYKSLSYPDELEQYYILVP